MNTLISLASDPRTIFTFDELRELYGAKQVPVFRNKLTRLVRARILERIIPGIYSVVGKTIDPFEFASKIYHPSYISFFSALYHHGIIFQYEPDIYLATVKSTDRVTPLMTLHLKRLKKEILLSPDGIIHNGRYSLASAERAFLDTIYLYGAIHCDNTDVLDRGKINALLPLYQSPILAKRVKKYFQ